MANKLGLDEKPRELILGSSFKANNNVAFHSIRYDFKPASVDTTKMSAVEVCENNSVSVTVPHVEGSGTANTVYKGNKRPCQKECVLIIDNNTGEITLEKLANTIQLKKTRQDGSSKAHLTRPVTPVEQQKAVKEHRSSPVLMKEQKTSPVRPKPPSPVRPKPQVSPSLPKSKTNLKPVQKDAGTLSSSDSDTDSSDSNDSSSDDDDDDDEFEAVKEPKKETPAKEATAPPAAQPSTAYSGSNINLLGHDLMLSESGSDSD